MASQDYFVGSGFGHDVTAEVGFGIAAGALRVEGLDCLFLLLLVLSLLKVEADLGW